MENIAPTKSNLMSAKTSLEFSNKGFELLDQKRNVLIREMMSYMSEAKELQEKINTTFDEAYKALMKANITLGISSVEQIATAIPEPKDFDIIFKSVMGVEVPKVHFEKQDIEPKYGFNKTNYAVDEAYKKFNEVKYLIFQLAQIESSVYKLAVEVKKTQKRANALENIQIPKFTEIVREIGAVLEEKEREDFFRLKMVKKKKTRK